MKVCILSTGNIRHMTLVSIYTDRLKKIGVNYDVIYMDKYGEKEYIEAENIFVFKNIIKYNQPRVFKIIKYYKFKKYAISIIKKHNYDFIIVWNDITLFMFADYLVKYWKYRYCLNIRDYLYQDKSKWIYNKFKKAVYNSSFTTISSNGFKLFLPKYDYIHVHSLNYNILKKIKPRISLRDFNKPIRIGFIGNIRFYEMNKKLLLIFKNDKRFELHYYGTNAGKLKTFAFENNINNTKFYDTFPVSDTGKYLNELDLINNLYGNESPALKYALSIKLYHGLYKKLPVLVNKNTWGARLIKKHGIGYVVNDITDNLKDEIFTWYTGLDFNEFSNSCDVFLEKIKLDNKIFDKVFHQWFKTI